ncbi:MAG: hypothetical protein PUG48_02740 [Clostridia bacterium]|nr:hypothetical protein [Clostridia bacterium]
MKKIAAMLLCICLIATFSVTAFAQNTAGGDSYITTVVPGFHKITVISDGAEVFIDGTAGKEFTVERLSEPTAVFKAEKNRRIVQVVLDDNDITDNIEGDSYTFEPVYKDMILTVTTEGYTEESTTSEPESESPESTPAESSQNSQGSIPMQTGETTNIAFWIVLIVLSAVIFTLSRQSSKKEKTNK